LYLDIHIMCFLFCFHQFYLVYLRSCLDFLPWPPFIFFLLKILVIELNMNGRKLTDCNGWYKKQVIVSQELKQVVWMFDQCMYYCLCWLGLYSVGFVTVQCFMVGFVYRLSWTILFRLLILALSFAVDSCFINN